MEEQKLLPNGNPPPLGDSSDEQLELSPVKKIREPAPVGEPTKYRSPSERGAGCFLMVAGGVILYTILFLPFRSVIGALILTVLVYALFRLFDRYL